jgi:hypothetical protein
MTAKKILLISNWHEKQAERYQRQFESTFSAEEKIRAKTCKEGCATEMLNSLCFTYLQENIPGYVTQEQLEFSKIHRPSTLTLMLQFAPIATRKLFSMNEPYYNMYFASWWIKKNWNKLFDEYIEYALRSNLIKVAESE